MHVHRGFWTVPTSFLLVALALTAGTVAQSDDMEDPNGVCHEIDPNMAIARGYAVPLRVKLLTQTIEPVRTQSGVVGPGRQTDADNTLNLDAPEGGNIAKLRLVNAHTESVVEDGLFAQQTSVAEVSNVTLLNGDIKATVLKGRANTRTTTSMADVTGNGTASLHVEVLGRVYDQVAPNTKIPLPADKFGTGSWIKLYERVDVGIFPHDDKPWYVANQTVRMIHVRVNDVMGLPGPVDIVVGEVHSYSQTPTPYCGGIQGINASAYGMRVKDAPFYWSPSTKVGYVKVAHTGGWNEETFTNVTVRNGAHLASADSITSRATGVVDLGVVSKSNAVAKLANVCVQADEDDRDNDCLIRAAAIRAESNSRAWHDEPNSTEGPDYDTISWGSSYILDLVVAGVDVCERLGLNDIEMQGQNVGCKPAKNTALHYDEVPGTDLWIYLNERQRDLDPEGHTEYTVRAVRIEGTIEGEPIAITLGRAYTEADYGAMDDS